MKIWTLLGHSRTRVTELVAEANPGPSASRSGLEEPEGREGDEQPGPEVRKQAHLSQGPGFCTNFNFWKSQEEGCWQEHGDTSPIGHLRISFRQSQVWGAELLGPPHPFGVSLLILFQGACLSPFCQSLTLLCSQ